MTTLIDTHSLLRAFGNHLSGCSTHLAHVLSGPSCEPWLQFEFFTMLNWSNPRLLQPNLFADPETKKRDIPIFITPSAPAAKLGPAVRIIELKLVYSNSKISGQLKELRRQMGASPEEKGVGTQRHGIVFGVWVSTAESNFKLRWRATDQCVDAFNAKWRGLVDNIFLPSFDIYPKDGVLPILGSTNVEWPHKKWNVALYAVSIHPKD